MDRFSADRDGNGDRTHIHNCKAVALTNYAIPSLKDPPNENKRRGGVNQIYIGAVKRQFSAVFETMTGLEPVTSRAAQGPGGYSNQLSYIVKNPSPAGRPWEGVLAGLQKWHMRKPSSRYIIPGIHPGQLPGSGHGL